MILTNLRVTYNSQPPRSSMTRSRKTNLAITHAAYNVITIGIDKFEGNAQHL